MFQNWYRLSFLHWPCDPARLQARLPVGLEIDTFDRTGWVGSDAVPSDGPAAALPAGNFVLCRTFLR
jgi:uncharacterized protein YqjF (DUF2071 family)